MAGADRAMDYAAPRLAAGRRLDGRGIGRKVESMIASDTTCRVLFGTPGPSKL